MVDPDTFENVQWAFDEDTGIGSIVIDRPDKLNALNTQTRNEIYNSIDAFAELDAAGDGVVVRCVVIEGAGDKAFSAGADLTQFGDTRVGSTLSKDMRGRIIDYGAPVIAKIDGYALGGGFELALACDFLIASNRSQVGQPEIDYGLPPGAGATQRLPDRIGRSKTKEICMTGDKIDGDHAAEMGLVDYAYPAEDLDDEVNSFAERITAQPPLGVRAVKELTNLTEQVSVREGIDYEWRTFTALQQTDDYEEAMTAYQEDREPQWQGR
jgi:enoyl-CoA hydratase